MLLLKIIQMIKKTKTKLIGVKGTILWSLKLIFIASYYHIYLFTL